MKLSQDIVFLRLLMKYPVRFLSRATSLSEVSYPLICETGIDLSGHTVIINSDEMDKLSSQYKFKETLIICAGEIPLGISLYKSSIIVVEKKVSLIGLANELYKIFNDFEQWDNALKSVVLDNGSVQDLVDCCDPIIIEPLAIIDNKFQIVASSKMSDELGYNSEIEENNHLSLDSFNNFIKEVDYEWLCNQRDTYILSISGDKVLSKNIFYNNEYAGRIAIKLNTDENYLNLYNKAILEHFYVYAVKLYSKYSSFDDSEFKKSGFARILQDSISNKKIPEGICEKIYNEYKWQKNDQLQLIQFMAGPFQEKPLYAQYLSVMIRRKWPDSICFTYMGHLLLLINTGKLNDQAKIDFFNMLSDFLKGNFLIAGISRSFIGISCLRSAYEQTETAVKLGILKNPDFPYFMFDDYALDYMLQNSIGHYQNNEICSKKLLKLIQHDKEKSTSYHKTLLTYIECKFNAAEAAKKLFINRSTFHYRLNKIQELADINFESSNELLYLIMSSKILDNESWSK